MVRQLLEAFRESANTTESILKTNQLFKAFVKSGNRSNAVEKYLRKNFKPYYIFVLPHCSSYLKETKDVVYTACLNSIRADLENFSMSASIFALQDYLILKEEGVELDEEIEKIISEMIKFQLFHTLNSRVFDNPTSTIDFKRCMIKRFKDNFQAYEIRENAAPTRAMLFDVLSTYLYRHDRENGLKLFETPIQNGVIPKNVSWNDEIKFIEEIERKSLSRDVERNEFLDETALIILKNLPALLTDRINGQRFIPTHEDCFEEIIVHSKHNSTFNDYGSRYFLALHYYIFEMVLTHKVEGGKYEYSIDEFFYDTSFHDYKYAPKKFEQYKKYLDICK